jgi:hypothetical protein
MRARWLERKLDDDLLKRELLLRLRAEHHGLLDRSLPWTDYFCRRVRRLMLRHPLFAFKYYLVAIDLGLVRIEVRDRGPLRVSGSLMLSLARQRRLLPARGARIRRSERRTVAALVSTLRRTRLLLHARLVRLLAASRAAIVGLPAEVRRRRGPMYGRLVDFFRPWGSAFAGLLAELRRRRPLVNAPALRASGTAVAERAAQVTRKRRAPRHHPHAIGAVPAGVVVAAAVATAVVATHGFRSRGPTDPAASAKPQSALLIPDEWWHPSRAVSTPDGAAQGRPRATKGVHRSTARPQAPRARSKPARQTILVSNTEPATSIPPAAPSSTSAAASDSNGATPLPAPTPSSGAPSPLKAPKR